MARVDPKRARKAISWLSVLTPISAIISVVNVTIAISTSVWLKTSEQIYVDASNATNPRTEVARTKRTVSGLWQLCEYHNLTQVNGTTTHCFQIDYFAKDRYTPEPHDSTMAVPYTVTKAGPLFFIATFLLAVGIISALLGYIWRRKRVATFIAGILFIIAGLIMLIGMVVYLSVLQAEVGQKLRPRNSLDKPVFEYTYGYSFIMVVLGFMSTEMTGTCAIFWYIYWHQLDWAEKAGGSSASVQQNYSPSSGNVHLHHHHHHHHSSGLGGGGSSGSGFHRQQQQQHGPRRQRSSKWRGDEDDFAHSYPHNSADKSVVTMTTTVGGGGGGGGGGEGFGYPSASSAEDNQLDCGGGGPLPLHYHHRHRSASHSASAPFSVFGLAAVDNKDFYNNKLHPCKKHGTIPPRVSNNHNRHRSRCSATATAHRFHHRYHHHQIPAEIPPSSSCEPPLLAAMASFDDPSPCCPCKASSGKHHQLYSSHHQPPPHITPFYYDDDLMADLDVLDLEIPPPPMPRDMTCQTTLGDYYNERSASPPRGPVPSTSTNAQNYSRERSTPRDNRKTTPV